MVYLHAGTSFKLFPGGGGKILSDFLGGWGQNIKKNIFCVQKHKKTLFFKIRMGGQMSPLPPPPNDVPAYMCAIWDQPCRGATYPTVYCSGGVKGPEVGSLTTYPPWWRMQWASTYIQRRRGRVGRGRPRLSYNTRRRCRRNASF